jgi:hypothetical protein
MTDYQAHPLRIQRKRAKGFRLPTGTVCVTRPGKWGNPFETADEFAVAFRMVAESVAAAPIFPRNPWSCDQEFRRMVVIVRDIKELHGKTLACWCSLDNPCHADVLAREASKRPVNRSDYANSS